MNVSLKIRKIAKNIISDSYTGRAWEGKLNRIDRYLENVYDKMIPADKVLKDTIFHAYYIHYNDGDFKSLPYSKLMSLGLDEKDITALKDAKRLKNDEDFQKPLEKAVDVTIKHLYNKYKGMIKRLSIVYKDLKEMNENMYNDNKLNGSFWVIKFGETSNNSKILNYGKELEKINKSVSLTKDLKTLDKNKEKDLEKLIEEELEKRAGVEDSIVGLS
jgi:hypothetical protein